MNKSRPAVTEEMFLDWADHPVTQVLRQVLERKRRVRKDQWEQGEVLELGKDQQMLLNAAAIGECQGLKFVQEMDWLKFNGEQEDLSEE